MDIKELKSRIETNTFNKDDNVIVFKYLAKTSSVVVTQYRRKFVTDNNLSVVFVDNLSDIPTKSIFSSYPPQVLYWYETDKLEDLPLNLDGFVWIVCNKINKAIDYTNVIEVPALEQWQITDYVCTQCKGLSDDKIQLLCNFYKNNIDRLFTEVDKISIFNELDRNKIFTYLDVSASKHYTVYDLVNALIRKDISIVADIMKQINEIELEPFGLLRLLINNFKHVIDIQLCPSAAPESLDMSPKQFWAIKKYSCGYYSKDELVRKYKFLLKIDVLVKSGQLDTTFIVSYIITYLLLA